MHPFSLLIKPVSDGCNLHCRYCFYLNKTPYEHSEIHRMGKDVLEQLISTYLATPQPCHIFTWQGGEPTLMGYDFFLNVVELQKKFGREGSMIANGVQTNATLLDDKLCNLFRHYNFLIGCSLDGPAEVHDKYRTTAKGKPTHSTVMQGIDMMRRHGVNFNIMTLVSQANVHKASEIYRYFRDQGLVFHQYIPCVEFDEKGKLQPFAINGEEWGDFLCRIFDEWYPDDVYTISIRHFDTIISKLANDEIQSCTIGKECRNYLVVEYNGDIYPCDFFVRKELCLGNIMRSGWEKALSSSLFQGFASRKSQWSRACVECEYLELCGGDCTRNRTWAADLKIPHSILCVGWKYFYNTTRIHFARIADQLKARAHSGGSIATSHSIEF
ncbi:MAG TPA: anaerobic sulfatase maturase [Desulfobulbaceae bacterium]|nr:anaerobic sulfatase maturase [Desulfobulbaceae bacterium]